MVIRYIADTRPALPRPAPNPQFTIHNSQLIIPLAFPHSQHPGELVRHLAGLNCPGCFLNIIFDAHEFHRQHSALDLEHCVAGARVPVLGFPNTAGVDHLPAAGQHAPVRDMRMSADQHIEPGSFKQSLQAAIGAVLEQIFIDPARAAVHQQDL